MGKRVFPLPPILMKIGERKNLLILKEKGEVYFGTYDGYRQQERTEFLRIKEKILNNEPINSNDFDLVKRDPLDGLDKTNNGKLNLTISNNGSPIELKDIEAKIHIFRNEYTHLYCMFGFAHKIPKNFTFDERLRKFGDHVLIFNSKAFLTALADNLKDKFDFNYVNYFRDDDEKPNLGSFAKRELFSYQYEYRVAANLATNKVIIGDVLNKLDDTSLIKFEDLSCLKLHIQ